MLNKVKGNIKIKTSNIEEKDVPSLSSNLNPQNYSQNQANLNRQQQSNQTTSTYNPLFNSQDILTIELILPDIIYSFIKEQSHIFLKNIESSFFTKVFLKSKNDINYIEITGTSQQNISTVFFIQNLILSCGKGNELH